MKLTSRLMPIAGTRGMISAAMMLAAPFCARADSPTTLLSIIVIMALARRIARPIPAISQRVRSPIRCGKANCMVIPIPRILSFSSSSHTCCSCAESGCSGTDEKLPGGVNAPAFLPSRLPALSCAADAGSCIHAFDRGCGKGAGGVPEDVTGDRPFSMLMLLEGVRYDPCVAGRISVLSFRYGVVL